MNKDDLAWWLTVILMGVGLYFLVAWANPAHAAEIARASMQDGATLHIRSEPCKQAEGALTSYTVDKNGRMYWSCWVSTDNGIVVVYLDGSSYMYPHERFTLSDAAKAYLKEKAQ